MRIALGIEYNGHGYHGWQIQHGLHTIQGHLEDALSKIANEPIYTHCAGRTDANVHATGQVIHFDTKAKRHIDAWIWGTNSHLPPNIVVRWAKAVDYHFHARFSAIARRYQYIIYNHPIRSPVLHNKITWHFYPLDIDKMRTAAKYLLGEKDFSAFRSSQCNSKTPMRNIIDVDIRKLENFVLVEIEANAFLHHMVRNIMGVLFKIGEGARSPSWMQEVIESRSRKAAAATAPAAGLYLMQVKYKEPYEFPLAGKPFLL